MKWLKKLVYRWSIQGSNLESDERANQFGSLSTATVEEARGLSNSNGIRLEFYKANGGYVIETRKYDRRKDENNVQLYLITNDQVLSDELSKIITMESLR